MARRKCCQRSTDDRRLLIALGVHLCMQRDRRDAARRAGSSASAETCFHAPFACLRVANRITLIQSVFVLFTHQTI